MHVWFKINAQHRGDAKHFNTVVQQLQTHPESSEEGIDPAFKNKQQL